ncbi:MAG: beta-propeller fold lactonase family protein [Planctomycetes bacterium]|nr:beta-propeller fold lactonase family protein [Planctomycetota bacterium]
MPRIRTLHVSLVPLALTALASAQTNYGTGTAGTGGITPRAWFRGSASPGSSFAVELDRALGGSPAFVVIGLAPTSVVAAGVEVLVQPVFSVFVGLTGGGAGVAGAGTAGFAIHVPNSSSFVGLPIHSQWLAVDPGGPQGISASDGLELHIEPPPLVLAAGTAGSLDRVYALDPTTGIAADWNGAIGADNPVAVEFTPNGEICIVGAALSHDFVIADALNNGTVLGSVGVGSALPNDVAITPDGRRAYGVTGGPQGSNLGLIIEIDVDPSSPTFGTQIGNVTGIPTGISQLEGVGISADGRTLAAVNLGLGQAALIVLVDVDPSSATFNTVLRSAPLTGFTADVRLNRDGSLAYVSSAGLGGPSSMLVVDTASGLVVATIPAIGDFPTDVEMSPRGDYVLVGCPNSDEAVRIDVDPASPGYLSFQSVVLPGQPFAIAIAPDGYTAWCSDQGGSDLYEIDTTAMTVLRTVPIGTGGADALAVR